MQDSSILAHGAQKEKPIFCMDIRDNRQKPHLSGWADAAGKNQIYFH